jgi:hypothetical protein
MKKFLKSRLFLTKGLPALFFAIPCLIEIYKAIMGIYQPTALEFFAIAIAAILLLNLYFRKYWISCVIGSICGLIFFYLIFAVLSEYSEFPNSGSFEALRLLIVGLLLCFSGITMGILLMLPYEPLWDNLKKYNNEC